MSLTTRHDLVNDFIHAQNKDIGFFTGQSRHKKWIVHHAILDPDYKIQCANFRDLYTLDAKTVDPNDQLELLTKQLALIDQITTMAQILVLIYRDALGITDEAKRYEEELILAKEKQAELREKQQQQNLPIQNDNPNPQLLAMNLNPAQAALVPGGYGADSNKEKTKLEQLWSLFLNAWRSITDFFRAYFKNLKEKFQKMFVKTTIFKEVAFFWNWLRLCLVRVRKVLNTLLPFLEKQAGFLQLVTFINKYTDKLFPYLAWIFFIPRLVVDLSLLAKGTARNFFKNKVEYKLDTSILFLAHLLRRWSRIGNDAVWMIAGILNCFILGPAFPIFVFMAVAFPVSVFITAALYFYDLLLTCIGAMIDLFRLSKLKEAYANKANSVLNEYSSYENKRIAWNVSIALITCVGAVVCFILPFIIPTAVVPLAGAFLLLCMSFILRYAKDYVIPPPPITKVTGLASFFKPSKLTPQAPSTILAAGASASAAMPPPVSTGISVPI